MGVSCQCGLIFSYLILWGKLFLSMVKTDMAAVCKYCVVIAVAVSAIFLSQQADAQRVMHAMSCYEDSLL